MQAVEKLNDGGDAVKSRLKIPFDFFYDAQRREGKIYANNFSSFLWFEAFLVLISKDILNFMVASKSFTRQETLPIRMMWKILSAVFRA